MAVGSDLGHSILLPFYGNEGAAYLLSTRPLMATEYTVFVGVISIYPQDISNYYRKCGLRPSETEALNTMPSCRASTQNTRTCGLWNATSRACRAGSISLKNL